MDEKNKARMCYYGAAAVVVLLLLVIFYMWHRYAVDNTGLTLFTPTYKRVSDILKQHEYGNNRYVAHAVESGPRPGYGARAQWTGAPPGADRGYGCREEVTTNLDELTSRHPIGAYV